MTSSYGPPSGPQALAEEEAVAAAVRHDHSTGTDRRSALATTALTFLCGGAANSVSSATTNPADIVKVRQQLALGSKQTSFWTIVAGMVRQEGVLSLWNGVTASILREMTYSAIRFGSYEPFKEAYVKMTGLDERAFAVKLLAGATSGAVGSSVACPTDLVKVRMQAVRPNGLPPYRNSFVAFPIIYRESNPTGSMARGVRNLYRAVGPTALRASVLTCSQVSCYDQIKGVLKSQFSWREGYSTHAAASFAAGFICSVTSAPFDTIKVRMMQDRPGPDGTKEFRGSIDCLGKLVRNEGPLALYKGFMMCWARLGTHTVIALMLFERFRTFVGIKPM